MDTRVAHIAAHAKVVDSEGTSIGTVKEVHEDHLVVSAGTLLKHDLYVPIDHITDYRDDELAVSIRASEVDQEGWRYPPNASFEHEDPAYPEVPDTTMMQAAGYSAGRLSAPEPQGAVLNDGHIDPGEVPNEDLTANDSPGATEDDSENR
ncbi:MAG: hypothetical protein ABIP77_10805 [Candidatus Limnocylindrales bacterium]